MLMLMLISIESILCFLVGLDESSSLAILR